MADDHSQRPYARSDQLYRSGDGPRSDHDQASQRRGSDPLAELARLIGEKDPFAEYGREIEEFRRASAPPQQGAYRGPSNRRASHNSKDDTRHYGADESYLPRHSGGDEAGGDNYLERQREAPAIHPRGAYSRGEDDPNAMPYDPEDQGFYDDEIRPRRRMGTIVVMGILGLAILGTAGAFGYRTFIGPFNGSHQPPVIKADSAPVKIVPAHSGQPNKLVSDRATERAQSRAQEKIVSREEQPVELNTRPTPTAPKIADDPPPAASGNGIVGVEPKKVHTIPILPISNGEGAAAVASSEPEGAAAIGERGDSAVAQNEAPLIQPKRNAASHAGSTEPPGSSTTTNNAPLSLNPATKTRPVARMASAGPTMSVPAPTNAAAGGYGVQVTSQRSEGEAQAAVHGLQAKYPSQLGGKKYFVQQVDLGSKGVYYRAIIGPFAKADAATEFCNSLKAVGGQCIIRKN